MQIAFARRMTRRDGLVALGLAVLLSATWLPRMNGPIDLRWDGAAYYIQGTSIFEGRGYRYINEPGDVEAVGWPPLMAGLVAAHQRVLGTSNPDIVAPVLRGTAFVIWATYIGLTYLLLRCVTGRWIAVAGCLLTGLHMSAIWLSDRLYADIPFALLATLFMICALRWPQRSLPAWAAATAAFYMRTAGSALFAAWVVDAALAGQWRTAAKTLALAALPVLVWQGYIVHVESSAAYANPPYQYARADYALYNVSYTRNMMLRDPLRPALGRASTLELPGRALSNLRTAVMHIGESVSLLEKDWVTFVTAAKRDPVFKYVLPWRAIPVSLTAFGVVVLLGALVCLGGPYRLLPLVLAFYIALLALLPTDYHWPRYLAGVAPLVSVFFLLPLAWLYRRGNVATSRSTRLVARFVAVGVFAAALTLQVITVVWYFSHDLTTVTHTFGGRQWTYRVFTNDEAFAAFDAGLDEIARVATADDVIVTSLPHWTYLRTGSHAVMPPFEADAGRARALLASVRPRFVIIDRAGFSPAKEYALPALRGDASRWPLFWEDDRKLVQIYEDGEKRQTFKGE